ncbi:MAG: methyltransferase domain-containing protein [Candidatus Eremiobacterota bacterium]
MWFVNDKTLEFLRNKIEKEKFNIIENLKFQGFREGEMSEILKEESFDKDEIHRVLKYMSMIHHKPGIKKHVAFVFSCPGRHEESLKRPAAKITGKNLEILMNILNEKKILPYKITYEDITITNAWDRVEYEKKTGRSEADKEEILGKDNLKRLAGELSGIEDYVICCGDKAFIGVKELVLKCRVVKIRHLGMRGLSNIKFDVTGNKILAGEKDNTWKRLEVVAKNIADEIQNKGKKIIKELDTASGYDRWAPVYEKDGNPMVNLDELVFGEEFTFNVKGKSVIDLGCGTGRHSIKFAEKGASVTALDISSGMLKEALGKKGSEKVKFICHDLSDKLPVPDGNFDFVISSLVLEHIENLLYFFKEAKRVCKKNGKIFITAMHPSMMLLDVQANFKDSDTGEEIRPKGYPNQMSDFVNAIIKSGLTIESFKEYFCTADFIEKFPRAKRFLNWPMVILFKLTK